ncbi:MAG: 50S ribosomal protein L21, partial [Gammaproteobacteria bacterium]|nr:50S ribosomal protein L21 [Gammaproteobacteria bacterium]
MNMYAVIETGGKQYKVGLGDRLKVEKLAAKEGDSIDIGRVLMIAEADQITFGKNASDKPVKAQVLGTGYRKKMKVFKKNPRRGIRRPQGEGEGNGEGGK